MRRPITHDWSGEAAALTMAAVALLLASLLAWALALGHMAEVGAICGSGYVHCVWCGVGAALGVAGLAALVAALAAAACGGGAPQIKRPRLQR